MICEHPFSEGYPDLAISHRFDRERLFTIVEMIMDLMTERNHSFGSRTCLDLLSRRVVLSTQTTDSVTACASNDLSRKI